MENIGEENKEDFLHDLRILYLKIFYPLTLDRFLLKEVYHQLSFKNTITPGYPVPYLQLRHHLSSNNFTWGMRFRITTA
jgi:hypothetical protein